MSTSSFLGLPFARDGLIEWVNLSLQRRMWLSVDRDGKVQKVVLSDLDLVITEAEEIKAVVEWISHNSGRWGISECALP